jgi:WD40 repeat protein
MGDETGRLIDAATGKELHKLEGHKNYVNTVAFTPDGKVLTTGSTDGTIRFWNTSDGAEQADSKLSTYKSIEDFLYTDNGKTFITNATEEVWIYQMP